MQLDTYSSINTTIKKTLQPNTSIQACVSFHFEEKYDDFILDFATEYSPILYKVNFDEYSPAIITLVVEASHPSHVRTEDRYCSFQVVGSQYWKW